MQNTTLIGSGRNFILNSDTSTSNNQHIKITNTERNEAGFMSRNEYADEYDGNDSVTEFDSEYENGNHNFKHDNESVEE